MREAFHDQLDSIFRELAGMCRLVETAVGDATRSLLEGDAEVAEEGFFAFAVLAGLAGAAAWAAWTWARRSCMAFIWLFCRSIRRWAVSRQVP